MSPADLASLSTDALLRRFEALCIQQYDALDRNEIAAFNRRYDKIQAIEDELQSRPGDQRRVLMQLFGHPNMHYAAARRQLEAIVEEQWFPQAGDAGMTLYFLDTGEAKYE
jgi:hypothetical protein